MKRRSLVVIIGVVAMVASATAAVAAHRFSDVPNDHVFHSEISWLADMDITRGCNPPANTRFCPNDVVTRGQMAAFLYRFYNAIDGQLGEPGPAGPAGP